MAERPSRCEWLQRILGETLSCRHRLCHAILDLPRKIVEQHRIVLRPGRLDEALHRGISLAPVRGTVAQDRGRTTATGRRIGRASCTARVGQYALIPGVGV